MSFISFDQKKLSKILSVCSKISSSKNPVEIYTFTKITVKKDSMVQFSTMNERIYFEADLKSINLEKLEEGASFLIKTELFNSAVNLISDEMIGLEMDLEKLNIIIQGSKSKHTLRINTDQLNNFQENAVDESKNEVKTSLKTHELAEFTKIARVAVGKQNTVYQNELLNICFTFNKINKNLTIASTDRFRVVKLVTEAGVENANFENESKNYLLPPNSLSILDYFESAKNIDLIFNTDFVVTSGEDAKFILKYGDGVFPDYNKIIPQSFVCSFSANTKDLLEALKQVQFSASINSESNSVKIKVSPEQNRITLAAETKDGYASESVVDIISYEGDETAWEQSFNVNYLVDYLNTVESSHILWEANPGKPAVLSPKNEKEKELYLVSGLR